MPSRTDTTSASATDAPAETDEITAPVARVEAYMREYLHQLDLPAQQIDAMEYALLAPGKRMRPILVIRGCEAVGGDPDHALPPAAAIEMIHSVSLVHDDLPSMDDDDLRRGRPTLHRHTNEAMAILAGDALMSQAYQLLADQVRPPQLATALIQELTRGTNAMIAGQVYDTLNAFNAEDEPLTRLQTIHRRKTGALIHAALRMGATVGGANREQIDALTRYAEAIGLMFQIVDDLLDVTQSTEHLGKTAGKDADQDKLTYPGLIGVDASRQEVQRLHNEAHAALETLGEPAQPLVTLCDYLAVRTK